MYRAREITVETNAFEDPIEPVLFFLIGRELELNTLIYLLSTCKATFSAINNLDIPVKSQLG